MRRTRYLLLLLAIYFVFIGGSSRYATLYQVRVLHHIVVTVVLSLWLIHRIRQKKGIPTTPLNTPLFALIGVWFISTLTSIDPRMAFENIWFPFTFIVIYFVIVNYMQRGRHKLIIESFLFVVVIVIFLTGLELASWYFGLGILPGTQVGWYEAGILIPPFFPKVSMAMGISTLVAGFTVPSFFITATWAFTVRRKSHQRILKIIGFFLFIVLILTFSRGGLLAFIGGLATFVIIRTIQHPSLTSRISPKLIGGIGGGIAIGLMLIFVALTLPFAIGRSDKGRLDMWESAVQITIDHPVTGVGPGIFGRAYRDYRDPLVARDKLASAHNVYLNTMSELGIIGVLVGGWLAYTLLKSSWHSWKNAKGRNQHRRIEGLFAGLVAFAIHSTVDAFTITPINFVFIIIVTYLVTGHRSILDPLPKRQLYPTYALLIIIVIFGVAFVQWDRAQGLFQSSFGESKQEALDLTRQAKNIDPYLNLYHLHEAYLLGKNARTDEEIEIAIEAYEEALKLEPTWDTGWTNLASLELQQGDINTALEYLQIASEIFPTNSANFAYARVADQYDASDDESIINAYRQSLQSVIYLPLAEVWWSTDLSTQATTSFIDNHGLEMRYRVYRVYQPEIIDTLVPTNPETASEWWIVGQVALMQKDLQTAESAFTTAIQLNPSNGDYYVSRAETRLNQSDLAEQDLQLAILWGTRYEYPNTVRALLADTKAESIQLKATALPTRTTTQEFAATLYSRPAVFDVYRGMRFPGLGESIIQPWYDVAESFFIEGNIDQAIRAYQFILENAPYESKAQIRLQELLTQ